MRLELPSLPQQWIEPVPYTGPPAVALALTGTLLAVADEDGTVTVRSLDPAAPGEVLRLHPDFPVGQLALSDAGSTLLIRSRVGDLIEVRQVRSGSSFRLAATLAGLPLAVAGFAPAGSGPGETLLVSTEVMRLQAIECASGQVLADRPVSAPRGFAYRRFQALADGDTVVALGYYAGEGKDSLVGLSVSRLLADDQYLPAELYRPRLSDYAYQLAAGPAGPQAMVVFRDAEQDEDNEDDDEDDLNRLDVHGLNGLYVRRLSDGKPGERIPYQADVTTGDSIFATTSHIALGTVTELRVIDRATGQSSGLITPAHAFHPATARVVLQHSGRLLVVTVPA